MGDAQEGLRSWFEWLSSTHEAHPGESDRPDTPEAPTTSGSGPGGGAGHPGAPGQYGPSGQAGPRAPVAGEEYDMAPRTYDPTSDSNSGSAERRDHTSPPASERTERDGPPPREPASRPDDPESDPWGSAAMSDRQPWELRRSPPPASGDAVEGAATIHPYVGKEEPSVGSRQGEDTMSMTTMEQAEPIRPREEAQPRGSRNREIEELQRRWLIAQAKLLDDPREAVQEAGVLVGDAMQLISVTFSEHRGRIERVWKDDANLETDELRSVMQRYRKLFQDVLSVCQLPDL